MIILGIETSCDETALSVIESTDETAITVLADRTLSQIELHKHYGGVFPNMAKREHSRNLIPLLKTVLSESNLISNSQFLISNENREKLNELLNREPEMLEQFLQYIPTTQKPPIDAIAVTEGPGLEPCLWTGINLAKALSLVWDVPVIPVNNMEGHIISALMRRNEITNDQETIIKQIPRLRRSDFGGQANSKLKISNGFPRSYQLKAISYPSLSLLISGGHTELVLIKSKGDYEIIGQTRDDAVGEAFDKVARLLGLPYPGGPEISKLAEEGRRKSPLAKGVPPSSEAGVVAPIQLPRPMLHSPDFDFSFSGIKTSVLYLLKKLPELTDDLKKEIALEFENAVTEVLIAKTKKALEQYGAQALLLGGGVVANTHIRREFEKMAVEHIPLFVPEKSLTTDNALMIAVVGLVRLFRDAKSEHETLKAQGNLRLALKNGLTKA